MAEINGFDEAVPTGVDRDGDSGDALRQSLQEQSPNAL